MAHYVPRLLICGDLNKFYRIIGDKPAKIVGNVIFSGSRDNISLFYDDKPLNAENLRILLDEVADYLIFTDDMQFHDYLDAFPLNTQVISAHSFANLTLDGFFSVKALAQLQFLLNHKDFAWHLLDFDCFIAKSDFRTNFSNSKVDSVEENSSSGKLFPIMENLYDKIYKNFRECKFHAFDAVILANERSPQEFIDVLIQTDALSDNIWALVRKNSPLDAWINDSKNIFAKIETFPVENATWYLLNKISPQKNVGIYVVTHKDVKISNLPACYRIIHAGKARAKENFGYLGDDSGDNISQLNPFLDEITALYWIWKNTSHSHTGIVHYRRFFTANTDSKQFSVENILPEYEILKILSRHDIIVTFETLAERSQRELMIYSTKIPDLVDLSAKVVRKHLKKAQPDYLDAFDKVFNGSVIFLCGIHITRRNIFDSYCEWLFSFILDATNELARKITFGDKKLIDAPHNLSRMMSFFSERMLTIWLMKNNLRIKSLPMMYRDDV